MNKEEASEILGDISAQLNEVLGLAQMLEENEEIAIDRIAELCESIEAALDLSNELYDKM